MDRPELVNNYKYLSQSDTCQLESTKEKRAHVHFWKKLNGTGLANKLKLNDCLDNFFFENIKWSNGSIIRFDD